MDPIPVCGQYPTDGKPVNVALQGGGSHGAFTWGVLDYLLEDGRIAIEALSGTSAGAMNAVVVADGMMAGGREGAREALERYWQAVSCAALTSPFQPSVWDILYGNWNLDHHPGFVSFDFLSRLVSPYQMNPLNLNPLRDIMESLVDFERLRRCDRVKIFISATNVRSGRVKVFRHDELCPEAILASACLPQLFQAVRIGDDIYWDGGYLGNPVLYPFFYRCTSPDVLIVQINPFTREHEPTTPVEIMDRLNEITFNSSLLAEFRALNFVAQLVEQGRVDSTRYKRVLLHIISGAEVLGQFTVSSKFNAHWGFLTLLRDAGRATAQDWLDHNIEHVGVRPTVDVREYYLSPDR